MTQLDPQSNGTDAAEATVAVPVPRGPVPDLGFFAGAPQPRDTGSFGGPAPAQLGGPALGYVPAGPVPAAPAGLGPIAALRSTAAGRWVFRLGAGLAISVVLGIFGIGRFALLDLFHDDLAVPSTLGGLSPSAAGDSATATLEAKLASVETSNGVDLEVQVYGEGTSSIVFIGATGEGSLSDDEMASTLNSGTSTTTAATVGDNVCVAHNGGAGYMCVRIEDGLMVSVLTVGRNVEDTSALTDEAWDVQ